MKETDRIIIMKKISHFTLDIIDFHDELIEQKKAPIAKRILTSSFRAICSLQNLFESEKISEIQNNKKNAISNFKNAIYWLEQCERSGYLFKEDLLLTAHELYSYCTG